jgi:hypothetical protein
MVKKHITLSAELLDVTLAYCDMAGINFSQAVRMGLELLVLGKVFVPLVGELSVNTTPTQFREFESRLDAAKEQDDGGN